MNSAYDPNEFHRQLKSGVKQPIMESNEEILHMLVAFGALVQMKEVNNLTEAAKKFLLDYDKIKRALKRTN